MEDVSPEGGDVQTDAAIVIPVHQDHVADQRGDGCANGGAQPLPPDAQGDGDGGVAQRHPQIDQRAELMHVLGPLYLNAHGLHICPQAGEEQQQRRPVVHGELFVAAPQHHKGLPDGHEAQKDPGQQDKL